MPVNTLMIVAFVVFVCLAVLMQRRLKGKMEGVKFYGEESLAIARNVIADSAPITFISCGTNKDTEKAAFAKGAARASRTGSTTQAHKDYDYSIVVKTDRKIYFIPVKIKGTMTLTLEQNPRLRVREYDIGTVRTEVLKRTKSNYMPTIDVRFITPVDDPHHVMFTDSFEEFEGL